MIQAILKPVFQFVCVCVCVCLISKLTEVTGEGITETYEVTGLMYSPFVCTFQ